MTNPALNRAENASHDAHDQSRDERTVLAEKTNEGAQSDLLASTGERYNIDLTDEEDGDDFDIEEIEDDDPPTYMPHNLIPTKEKPKKRRGQWSGYQLSQNRKPEEEYEDQSCQDSDESEEEEERSSWMPIDLDPILFDEVEQLWPTIGHRDDGLSLFYRGRQNWVVGESESAKTWLALLAVLHTIESGEYVVFIDYDDRAKSIVSRLLAMGAEPDDVGEYLRYINPKDPLTDQENWNELSSEIEMGDVTLVVIDSATYAAVNEGWNIVNDANDLIEFSRLMDDITRLGAEPAVVVIDHTNPGPLTRYPGGSKAKRNLVDLMYVVESVTPFMPGDVGESRIWLSKDKNATIREHSLRRHGFNHIEGPNMELAGILVGDGTSPVERFDVYVRSPERALRPQRLTDASTPRRARDRSSATNKASQRRSARRDAKIKAIEDVIKENPHLSDNKVYEQVGGNRNSVLRLIAEVRAGISGISDIDTTN